MNHQQTQSAERKARSAPPHGSALFAWEVSVKGTDWTKIVNARTAGQAKRDYHLDVRDAWPDVPYTAMRCRKIGAPHTSERFKHNARYRGMPDVQCGQRVKVGEARGVIVGHNESANFDVLFDDDSPKYAGLKLNCHPSGVELETNMPTTMNIPSQRERHCSPCEHLKSNSGMRGGPGNVWDWWCCMHPEANNSSPLSDDPKIRDKQIELRARMAEHGRSIGKSLFAKQPDWCPLLREQAS